MSTKDESHSRDQSRGEATTQRKARGRRVWGGIGIIIFWVLMAISAVLVCASFWVWRQFGVLSFNQLLINLPKGEGAGGSAIVASGVRWGLIFPLAVVSIAAIVTEIVRRWVRRRGWLDQRTLGMGRQTWLRIGAWVLAIVVPLGSVLYAASITGVDKYVQANVNEALGGATMEDYYVAPEVDEAALAASGREPKNLIVIYLESIEEAYLNESGLFETNMLEPIDQQTEDWASIDDLRGNRDGNYTIAGLVATQCGVPLRTPNALYDGPALNNLGNEGAEVDSYLSEATCLGDVFDDQGYETVFLGGADPQFSAKGAFLNSHGYDQVVGLPQWRELGETEFREDWGLSDRRLFTTAESRVEQLWKADDPFMMSILTLDTHELPYVFPYCDVTTKVELESITRCSMQEVANFIATLESKGILEDTAVAVMGDHLKTIAVQNQFYEQLSSMSEDDHRIFNRFTAPEPVVFKRDDMDQMSILPTLVELADIPLVDHRGGLGVSAFADKSDVPSGTILDLSQRNYEVILNSPSREFYSRLWGES